MSDEYRTPAPRPCSCIAPGEPLTLHRGHCCVLAMSDNDEWPPCHRTEWAEMYDEWPPCHRTEWEEMHDEQLEDPVK